MTFQARDPVYEQRGRDNFLRQGFMRHLGVELVAMQPGRCELRLKYDPAFSQQHGYFHGGVLASLADVSAGYAAFSLLPPAADNLTVEFKLNYLSPGAGQTLVAQGVVLKAGRTLTTCRSDVYVVQESGRRELCATALATYMARAETVPNHTDRRCNQ